jgi:inhibitor of cysteine peptidase
MRATVRTASVCAVAVLLALLVGCSATQGPASIGEAANGTEVVLAVGQTLQVSLPANVTTGFDWAVDGAVPSQLTSVSDTYDTTAPAGVVGAGGTRTFVFRADSRGNGALRLVYARSWESGPPQKTFAVTVVVK